MKILARTLRPFILSGFSVCLVACSSSNPSDMSTLVRPVTDRIAAVKTIRAANAGEDSALQVNPLREFQERTSGRHALRAELADHHRGAQEFQ